jgi:hypothetical protein
MQRGARRLLITFPEFELLEQIFERARNDPWEPVNPDFPELADKWEAIHFIEHSNPTDAMARHPEMQKIGDWFQCDINFMMLYKTNPGTVVHEHRDMSGNLPMGRLRFHIPIVTNPGIEFYVEGERVKMCKGELWGLDTSYLHAFANRTDKSRIHLLVEVYVNDWVHSMLPPRDKRDVLHDVRFFATAGAVRTRNILMNPKLAFQTTRQVVAILRHFLDRKARVEREHVR